MARRESYDGKASALTGDGEKLRSGSCGEGRIYLLCDGAFGSRSALRFWSALLAGMGPEATSANSSVFGVPNFLKHSGDGSRLAFGFGETGPFEEHRRAVHLAAAKASR